MTKVGKVLEHRLVELPAPGPCVKCPFWQHRNGTRVPQPVIRAVLVRTALEHPWIVASGSVGLFLAFASGFLVGR